MSGTIYVRGREDGSFLADVAELPGCVAVARSREEAIAGVRKAFTAYIAMLESNGVSTNHWKTLDPASFEVREPLAPGNFKEDFQPPDEHERRDFLHQLEASRTHLLSLVAGLDQARLERRPDADTWSVRQALEHIATTDVVYMSKLEAWPGDGFPTLQAVHRMVAQRVSVMDPAEATLDHTIQGQRWSVRKFMRRILAHEYEHVEHIKEILARLD